MDFKIVRKGYDTKETKEYILNLQKQYEDEIEKQKALISMLKEKLLSLTSVVKEYEKKEEAVSKAIIRAVEKAEEIEKQTQEKYAQEISSLKAFHLRWNSYYKKLIKKYPIDEDVKKAQEFNEKINEIFTQDEEFESDKEALEYFRREQEKITGIPAYPKKAKPGAFDYNEALNPTDDLAKILSDLNLGE